MILDLLAKDVVLGDGGALFELERRGYLSAGPFVPSVSIEQPEALKQMQTDYARAGSQVLQAVTYYAHEDKLAQVGLSGRLEDINRSAVRIAREVADEYGCLVAGDLANSWVFDPGNQASFNETRRQFDDQIRFQEGADFFIGETMEYLGEALIALKAIKEAGFNAMITMSFKNRETTLEGHGLEEAMARLEDAGADIVGLNCFRDPALTLPLAFRVRQAVSCHVATQPVAYRCSQERPYFQIQEFNGHMAFPLELDPLTLTRFEMADYAQKARDMGIGYIGACCGTGPHHIRAMAEALGRTAPNSRYSPRLELHPIIGDDSHQREKDARTLCEQKYGAAHCHSLFREQKE